MTTAKVKFLLRHNIEIIIYWGETNFWWWGGGESTMGIFPGEGSASFQLVWGTIPIAPVKKTLYKTIW